MPPSSSSSLRLRFGAFELDPSAGQLRKNGTVLKLPPQPFRVLLLLVERSGTVVSREEIQNHLWSDSTFVDFEHGINFSINQIRAALADNPEKPRYIETLPRRGYRFIAPVDAHDDNLSPDAQTAFLKASHYLTQESAVALHLATSLFQESIGLAPAFAPNYAGVAAAYVRLGHWLALPPGQCFPNAKRLAVQALDLDDSFAEAHTALGDVFFLHDWNWHQAEKSYQRALRLNPSSPQTLRSYAGFLLATGRLREADLLAQRAVCTGPASTYLGAFSAAHFFSTRNYEQAVQAAQTTLGMDPQCSTAHLFLGLSLVQLGEFDEALKQLQRAVSSVGLESRRAHLAYAFAVSGRVSEAEELLHQLQEELKNAYVSPWLFAVIYAGLRRKDQAFDSLEHCYREREHDLVFSNIWPQFDILRPDPRWCDLIRRIRLPHADLPD